MNNECAKAILDLLCVFIPAILSAFAACFAAFTACKSWQISKQTLAFQKDLAKNQFLLNILWTTLGKISTLKTLLDVNLLSMSDGDFCSIEPLFIEIRKDLEELSCISNDNLNIPTLSEITTINDLISALSKDRNYLADKLKKLRQQIERIVA